MGQAMRQFSSLPPRRLPVRILVLGTFFDTIGDLPRLQGYSMTEGASASVCTSK